MGSPPSSSTSCFFRYPLVSFSVLLLFLGCFSCFTSSACLVSMFMGSSALLYFHFINKNGVKKAISIEKTSEDPEDELLLIDGTEHLITKDESSDDDDDDDDDDESLIEIALQEGHYMTSPDGCSPEFFLGQHGLKELFSDVGEEENLIEIDISMGSIKCS